MTTQVVQIDESRQRYRYWTIKAIDIDRVWYERKMLTERFYPNLKIRWGQGGLKWTYHKMPTVTLWKNAIGVASKNIQNRRKESHTAMCRALAVLREYGFADTQYDSWKSLRGKK